MSAPFLADITGCESGHGGGAVGIHGLPESVALLGRLAARRLDALDLSQRHVGIHTVFAGGRDAALRTSPSLGRCHKSVGPKVLRLFFPYWAGLYCRLCFAMKAASDYKPVTLNP